MATVSGREDSSSSTDELEQEMHRLEEEKTLLVAEEKAYKKRVIRRRIAQLRLDVKTLQDRKAKREREGDENISPNVNKASTSRQPVVIADIVIAKPALQKADKSKPKGKSTPKDKVETADKSANTTKKTPKSGSTPKTKEKSPTPVRVATVTRSEIAQEETLEISSEEDESTLAQDVRVTRAKKEKRAAADKELQQAIWRRQKRDQRKRDKAMSEVQLTRRRKSDTEKRIKLQTQMQKIKDQLSELVDTDESPVSDVEPPAKIPKEGRHKDKSAGNASTAKSTGQRKPILELVRVDEPSQRSRPSSPVASTSRQPVEETSAANGQKAAKRDQIQAVAQQEMVNTKSPPKPDETGNINIKETNQPMDLTEKTSKDTSVLTPELLDEILTQIDELQPDQQFVEESQTTHPEVEDTALQVEVTTTPEHLVKPD